MLPALILAASLLAQWGEGTKTLDVVDNQGLHHETVVDRDGKVLFQGRGTKSATVETEKPAEKPLELEKPDKPARRTVLEQRGIKPRKPLTDEERRAKIDARTKQESELRQRAIEAKQQRDANKKARNDRFLHMTETMYGMKPPGPFGARPSAFDPPKQVGKAKKSNRRSSRP